MEQTNKLSPVKPKRTCVDLHVHGGASNYVDAHATASIYEECNYFSDLAKKNNFDKMYVALTDHNTAGTVSFDAKEKSYKTTTVMTYDLYNKLKQEFPNVEPILGIEANCNLLGATDGIFKKAHITAFADMSSEESIKRWIENKDLKDLSYLKTYMLTFCKKTNYEIVSELCESLNLNFGLYINPKDLQKYKSTNYSPSTLRREFIADISPKLLQMPMFKNCKTQEDVKRKLESLQMHDISEPTTKELLRLRPSYNRYDTPEKNVENACLSYLSVFADDISVEDLKNRIDFSKSPENIDEQFIKLIANRIAGNPKIVINKKIQKLFSSSGHYPNLIKKKIYGYSPKNQTHNILKYFNVERFNEYLGVRFLTVRNMLNKEFGTKIELSQIANILRDNNDRTAKVDAFYLLVMSDLVKNNKDFSHHSVTIDEAKRVLNQRIFGPETAKFGMREIVPEEPRPVAGNVYQRVDFEEFHKIIKNAGGYICMAHPTSSFEFADDAKIKRNYFYGLDMTMISNNEARDLQQYLANNEYLNVNSSNLKQNMIFKLELLNNLLMQSGCKLDAVEMNKDILGDSQKFSGLLKFCAKHKMDLSFGTDTHLSMLHNSYQKLKAGKISDEQYEQAKLVATKKRDNTTERKITRGYLKQLTKTLQVNTKKFHFTYKVQYVSMLNRIFSKNKTKQDDVLLALETTGVKSGNFYDDFDALEHHGERAVTRQKVYQRTDLKDCSYKKDDLAKSASSEVSEEII